MIFQSIQIKILAAILLVLVAVAAILLRGGHQVTVTPQDKELQKTLNKKVQPSAHRYLVP
jgi:uncharacterized membrane protein affecting hemolysin expression